MVVVATTQVGVFLKPVTPVHVIEPMEGRVISEGKVKVIVEESVIVVERVNVKV